MQEELTHNPHDKFFKESFSRKETAVALFREFLPSAVVQSVDWDTLKEVRGTFIEESLRETRSDLLFEVSMAGEPLRLYCLFEHQSTQDKRMPLRLLGYMVQIWERFAKEYPANKSLPTVIPLVLHQSLDRWQASVHFQDLFASPADLKEALSPYQPDFAHLLIDLPEIQVTQRLDLSLAVIFQIMRTVEERTIVEKLHQVMQFLGELYEQRNDVSYLRTCINYLLRADSTVDKQAFFHKLETIENHTIKEQTMSIADVLIEEGIKKGIEKGIVKGRQEGRQALIRQVVTLHEILGYSHPNVQALQSYDLQVIEAELEKLQMELKVRLS